MMGLAERLGLSLVLVTMGLEGCAPAAIEAPPQRQPTTQCDAVDAGDQAWVRRAMDVTLGRGPYGHKELLLLTELVDELDRESVAQVLMSDPLFISRWSPWLMDFAGVNRVGSKDHRSCFETPLWDAPTAALASRISGAPSSPPEDSRPFNMADVIQTSLEQNDLSLFLRANLFAMFARPAVYCGNTPADEMELTRRREFATKFTPTYTGRTRECLACHNSAFSVTDIGADGLDRHWPLPGRLEAAVFGADVGLDEFTSMAAFRFMGVAGDDAVVDEEEREDWPTTGTTYVAPWGMDSACGTLLAPDAVQPDELGFQGYLAGDLGDRSSIWDVERQLAIGMASLASSPPSWGPGDIPEGPRALAYMVAARVADAVWAEATGHPLTLSHGFPRNRAQRDTLEGLATALISSGWSLRALLSAVLRDPNFNARTPDVVCGESAYIVDAIHDPFSVHADAQDMRANSVGDTIARAKPWVLLGRTHHPLGWTLPSAFPADDTVQDYELLKAAGAFLADDRPGFRGFDFQTMTDWEFLMSMCRPEPIGVDETCDGANDDCLLYPEDWLDGLLDEALSQNARVRDVVLALKDRLWASPQLTAEEEALIEALTGQKMSFWVDKEQSAQTAMRAYCGVLLTAPQTVLSGVVAPDIDTDGVTLTLLDDLEPDHCQYWAERAVGVDIAVSCGTTQTAGRPTP